MSETKAKSIEMLFTKEYKGKRIIHFSDLAYIFKSDIKIFETSFLDNNDIFMKNKDYYILDKAKNNINVLSNILDTSFETPLWAIGFYISNLMSSGCDLSGHIYVAFEPEKEVYKIGRTSGEVEKRIKQLNTGRTIPITNVESYYCKNIVQAEKTIHSILKDDRIVGEWFSTDINKIRSVVKQVVADINDKYKSKTSSEIIFLTESAIPKLIDIVNKSYELNLSTSNDLITRYFSYKSGKNTYTNNCLKDKYDELLNLFNKIYIEIKELIDRLTPKMPNYNLWIDDYAIPAMTKVMKKCNFDSIEITQKIIFDKMKENHFCYEFELNKFCIKYNIQDETSVSPLWVVVDNDYNVHYFVDVVNQLMEVGAV